MMALARSARLESRGLRIFLWVVVQVFVKPLRLIGRLDSSLTHQSVRTASPSFGSTWTRSIAKPKIRIRWGGDKVLQLVIILAIVASVTSTVLAYRADLITAFRDGEARLIIARLVMDSNNPGFTNLAGNWPPSPQSEWVFLTKNDFLYQSGLAGTIVSMMWYVISVFFLYKLIVLATNDRTAAAIGVVAFSVPNLLFMQATPMSEVPYIGRMLMAFYFLACWTKNPEKWHLLFFSGFAVSWATLTRYESWGLLPAIMALIVFVSWRNGFDRSKTLAHLHVFTPIAVSGIIFWLGLNLVIFGDPLFFARSEFSAGQIAERTFANLDSDLQTEGNLPFILQILSKSAIDIIGLPVVILSILGLGRLALVKKPIGEKLVSAGLLYPILFYILTMYVGFSTVIWHPDYFDGQNWGTRYLTMMLPAAGLLCGILVSNRGWLLKAPILILVIGSAFITTRSEMLTVHEARAYDRDPATAIRVELANWLDENYDRGLILLFRVGHEKIFRSETIPLDRLVYEGSTPDFWKSSLNDPVGQHIDWIVMRNNLNGKPDRVWSSLRDSAILRDNYYLVYQDEEVEVYKIQPGKDKKSLEGGGGE